MIVVGLLMNGGSCEGRGGAGTIVGISGGGGSERVYTVTYTASATGDGVIDQVRYRDPDGVEQRVSDPGLPFAVNLTMAPGDQVAIFASGSVSDGEVRTGLVTSSSDDQGTILDEEDSCQSSGVEISCNLGTPEFALQ